MGKYIDAEKLKAEINERLHCNGSFDECGDTAWDYDQGMVAAYNYVLSVIASLQQEQEKSKKDCNGCPHCVDRKDQYGWHFKGCFGGPYNGKFIAEIDECPLKQEQPEISLEKFTEKMDAWKARYNYPDNIPIKAAMAFTARMFYMYPNAAREWYDNLPKVSMD